MLGHPRSEAGETEKLPHVLEIEELMNTVALKGHQKYYCCNEHCLVDNEKKKPDKDKQQQTGAGQAAATSAVLNQGAPLADRAGAGFSIGPQASKIDVQKDDAGNQISSSYQG